MKKIFFIISFMMLNFVYAATDWNSQAALKRVNTIGTKLLKANNVNYDIEFKVSDEADINAYANINKEIAIDAKNRIKVHKEPLPLHMKSAHCHTVIKP
jgi:hypothetical protein